MMTERNREYRSYATMGGGFFGALSGIVGLGPQIANGEIHFFVFAAIVFGSTAIGALICFFFMQIFIGQLAVRGPIRQTIGSEGHFQDIGEHDTSIGHHSHGDFGDDSDH